MRIFEIEAFESHTCLYRIEVEDDETAEDAVKQFQAGNGEAVDGSMEYRGMDDTRGGLGANQLRMLKHEVPAGMDTSGIFNIKEIKPEENGGE